MGAAHQPADRHRRASAAGDCLLLCPLDGGGLLSHAEIRLPRRTATVRAHRPPVALSGRVLDRGVADALYLTAGARLPGDELRSDLRAGRMEVGLSRGAERVSAAPTATSRRPGADDCSIGRLRGPSTPRSARSPNPLAGSATYARLRPLLGTLRPRG